VKCLKTRRNNRPKSQFSSILFFESLIFIQRRFMAFYKAFILWYNLYITTRYNIRDKKYTKDYRATFKQSRLYQNTISYRKPDGDAQAVVCTCVEMLRYIFYTENQAQFINGNCIRYKLKNINCICQYGMLNRNSVLLDLKGYTTPTNIDF